MSCSEHWNNIEIKRFFEKKKCVICNLQIFYNSDFYYYYRVKCGCKLCGVKAYICYDCVSIHGEKRNCWEKKKCWMCKTIKCAFF